MLFIITYSAFVKWGAPSWWSATQSTDQENMVKARNFVYNKKTYKNIIVGSSLSARIVGDSLPDTYNLAFGGLSAYDGLHIITRQKAFPRVVLIEMNLVFRPENTGFISSLFSPLMYFPKSKIEALREDKEPIVVSGKIILNSIYAIKDRIRGIKAKDYYKNVPVVAPVQNNSTTNLSDKMVNELYLAFFNLPGAQKTNDSFTLLKNYVNELKSNGVKVVFYEMPIDNKLENLPLTNFIRNKFQAVFPPSQYKYIGLPGWSYVDTFDGQHLSEQAALTYTRYLREQLDKP